MGAEQEARPRPLILSAVTAAASHLQDADSRGHVRRGGSPKKKKKNNNMETSQLQECFCCLHFRNQSELLSVSRNAKEKATSAAALFQFLPTDCGESLKTPPAKLLLYFSSLFKRLLSSSATITRITGTGGEHCSVGVQFAVSTRLARFITN